MKIGKLRLFLIIIWIILAGLIIWFKVVPLGHASYSKNYLSEFNLLGGKGLIGKLTPVDRLVKNSDSKIIGDPIYFSIFTPRTFDEVKLTITYKPELGTKTPIIETGVLVDHKVWRYKMAPLQNQIIDGLKDWFTLRQEKLLILQRVNTFSDVPTALTTLKNYEEIAWYNSTELAETFPQKKFETISAFKIIEVPLRGAHQFYFLASKEQTKNFSFEFSDLNIDKDSDEIEINIYNQSQIIYSQVITDDFNGELDAKRRDFDYSFIGPELSNDIKVYKLEIKAGDDIIINKILSAPSALSALGRLKLATAPNKALTLWTDSSYLQITATDPAGRQKINFDNQEFLVPEAYFQFELVRDNNSLKKIELSKADLLLENDSTFSFNKDSYLNPNFQQLNHHFILDDKTDYVIANYNSPQSLTDGWRQATVTLNTKEAYREKGKYSFILSVPGLSLAKEGSLEIGSIKAEFSGRNIWEKIKELIISYAN